MVTIITSFPMASLAKQHAVECWATIKLAEKQCKQAECSQAQHCYFEVLM